VEQQQMTAQANRPEDKVEAEAEGQVEGTDEATQEGEEPAGPTPEELKAKADENWDRYVRAVAELDNVRKRATRDVENAHKFALERFSKELLAVKDSLEMGLAHEDADADSLRQGSEATLKVLAGTLERFGVVEINPVGEPFDPEFHEAMTVQPAPDAEPGSVLKVVQKGYTLNGRLLRPAMVIVVAEA
jgi:molecular chaperone GrpE